jgi:hypothetical protein
LLLAVVEQALKLLDQVVTRSVIRALVTSPLNPSRRPP